MHDLLDGSDGERMELAAYYADYEEHFWKIDSLGFWKLERQQFFQEPGHDTWDAFAEGDWEESLRRLEAGRPGLEAYFRQVAEHGFAVRRVRVVEEPLTAYMQWELHALRLRERCGAGVRVVGPEQVAPLEASGQLPEIYTLGTDVMYEAIYDERGILEAARRWTDRELILRIQQILAELYEAGEPLADYFDRKVASLPPPTGQRTM